MAALAIWNRPPDPRLFSVGAPSAIEPAEVRRSLEPWITAAGVSLSDVEFIGDVPSRRFFLRVLGGPSCSFNEEYFARAQFAQR
eukprot:2629015-Pyramimonas_sp.AAC.1